MPQEPEANVAPSDLNDEGDGPNKYTSQTNAAPSDVTDEGDGPNEYTSTGDPASSLRRPGQNPDDPPPTDEGDGPNE